MANTALEIQILDRLVHNLTIEQLQHIRQDSKGKPITQKTLDQAIALKQQAS